MPRIDMRWPGGAAFALLFAACASSGAGGREVRITQTDSGCTPASMQARPGEKLKLVVRNDSGQDIYEIEGIEGTKLEELRVPQGRTRTVGYTVPQGAGTHKINCYVPSGASTTIEITVAESGTASPQAAGTAVGGDAGAAQDAAGAAPQPAGAVAVTLLDDSVSADRVQVRAGTVRFIATNASTTSTHELVVLQLRADGTFETFGRTATIAPGAGASVTARLTPGRYQLACLLVPGESGSMVDHYQQGMRTEIEVQ